MRINSYKIICTFFLFFCIANIGCKKSTSSVITTPTPAPSAPLYDFAYTGSQYTVSTLHFTSNAPSTSTPFWDFGDSTSSSAAAPDHVYTHTGAYIVSLVINGDTTERISKTVYIGADSAHQALLNNTWMFHHQSEGFYPPIGRDTTYYLSDASYAVVSVAPGAILFINDTLYYDSSTDSTIHFSKILFHEPVHVPFGSEDLTYNYLTNKIIYHYSAYVSAGGGIWTDTYTSY